MNVEQPEFLENTFDVVYGSGVLHHANIPSTLAEILRVLKPGGLAIFREPMGHNPVINLFRRGTPHLRSEAEHPPTTADLALIRGAFHRSECKFFRLFSLVLAPLAGRLGVSSLLHTVDRFDGLVMRHIPALARFAWQAVLFLEEPRKVPPALRLPCPREADCSWPANT